jgi:hypothetical protein
MGVKNFWGTLTLLTGVLCRPCFASDVTMELRAWPAPTSCEACVTLQFGVLEMRLPTKQIGKIFISGKEPFAVHLLPQGAGDARNSALLLSATRDAYIGKYQAFSLGAAASMSGQEFFDMLGRPARSGDPLAKIRRVEGIDIAQRYIKASKGSVHAYWIKAAPENVQHVHLVIDGDDTVYSLVGTVTPQLYDAVLTNLRITPEP